jgi:hypothetical protein
VFDELLRAGCRRREREGPSDVDARVVVAAPHRDAALGLDIDHGRHIQLRRTRSVACLPDREQLGEPAAMAAAERCPDGVEGVGQRADDAVGVEVFGARLDVTGVGLQPLVVVGRDPEAEHVNGLRLTVKVRRQLLRDKGVGAVGDRERTIDRVVVGDRYDVHPATLCQLIDLLGGRRALGQAERSLDAQSRQGRGARVAVEVDPGCHGCFVVTIRISHATKIRLQTASFCDQSVNAWARLSGSSPRAPTPLL